MATKIGALAVYLTGKDSGFSNTMNRAMKTIGKVKLGIIAAVAAISAFAIKLAKESISLASVAQETDSKFNAVFKNITQESKIASENLAKDFKLASSTAKELLGDTGDLLSGFGFSQSMSLDISNQVNRLALDLASFTNYSGGAKGASQALTRALIGERKAIKSLGISILEKDVKEQIALNRKNGLVFATERQAKAYSTLQIAQEQSKNAIGDYVRTADSLANVMRRYGEASKDFKENLGQILITSMDLARNISLLTNKLGELTDKMKDVNLGNKLKKENNVIGTGANVSIWDNYWLNPLSWVGDDSFYQSAPSLKEKQAFRQQMMMRKKRRRDARDQNARNRLDQFFGSIDTRREEIAKERKIFGNYLSDMKNQLDIQKQIAAGRKYEAELLKEIYNIQKRLGRELNSEEKTKIERLISQKMSLQDQALTKKKKVNGPQKAVFAGAYEIGTSEAYSRGIQHQYQTRVENEQKKQTKAVRDNVKVARDNLKENQEINKGVASLKPLCEYSGVLS